MEILKWLPLAGGCGWSCRRDASKLAVPGAHRRPQRPPTIPLNVSGAFHSPFMEPARKEFETFLESFTFDSPTIPVISNVEATPYPRDGVAELLAQQITSPVRWVETIQYLKKQFDPAFEEMGPGKVLRGLIRQIS